MKLRYLVKETVIELYFVQSTGAVAPMLPPPMSYMATCNNTWQSECTLDSHSRPRPWVMWPGRSYIYLAYKVQPCNYDFYRAVCRQRGVQLNPRAPSKFMILVTIVLEVL